ncbi:putative ABC transporter permease [Lachnospiraceae bacterium LCP25S3_G4]
MLMYVLILQFFVYGFLGWCTEVAYAGIRESRFVNRGFLNGPICPIYGFGVVAVVTLLEPYKANIFVLYITSVILVTILEYVTGLILEKIFHNKWWDYSSRPFNIQGYVCLLFSTIWGVACVLIVEFIHPLMQKGLSFIPYVIGMLIVVVLLVAMISDLYVTASEILKMNKRLAKMEEIAKELHRISDDIGQNIYKEVSEAIERKEAITIKNQEVSEEIKAKIIELKGKYKDIGAKGSKISRRLVKAFPKMESRHYKEALEDIKKQWKRK